MMVRVVVHVQLLLRFIKTSLAPEYLYSSLSVCLPLPLSLSLLLHANTRRTVKLLRGVVWVNNERTSVQLSQQGKTAVDDDENGITRNVENLPFYSAEAHNGWMDGLYK